MLKIDFSAFRFKEFGYDVEVKRQLKAKDIRVLFQVEISKPPKAAWYVTVLSAVLYINSVFNL